MLTAPLRLICVSASFAVCGLAQVPAALQVIGITGKWTSGKQQLVIGSGVSADSVLVGGAGATIMLGSSGGRYFKRCEEACKFTPSSEKPQSEPGGFWDRLVSAVRGYKQEGVVAAVSRGEIGRNLNDAVVRLEGGKVDVSPAFRGVMPGPVHVRLGSQPEATAEWHPGSPLWVPAGGIKLGIQELALGDVSRAVVLVAPADRFEYEAAEYQQAVKATADWPREIDAHPALRAFMESLAREAK